MKASAHAELVAHEREDCQRELCATNIAKVGEFMSGGAGDG